MRMFFDSGLAASGLVSSDLAATRTIAELSVMDCTATACTLPCVGVRLLDRFDEILGGQQDAGLEFAGGIVDETLTWALAVLALIVSIRESSYGPRRRTLRCAAFVNTSRCCSSK